MPELNPFYAAYETSLSKLTHSEWCQLSSRWAQGIDYFVYKVGKKWALIDAFGGFPLFTTKKAAYEAGSRLILAESRWRAHQQWEQDHA